jgi:hypothetical protein
MGLNQAMKICGYNAKERAYVIGGTIAGAVAPVIGARYLLFHNADVNGVAGEVAIWGLSLLVNASSMIIRPHLPVPAYTAVAGMAFGTIAACSSKRKRNGKALEDI